jgi:tetratricopeptide (TPR) repeat protein
MLGILTVGISMSVEAVGAPKGTAGAGAAKKPATTQAADAGVVAATTTASKGSADAGAATSSAPASSGYDAGAAVATSKPAPTPIAAPTIHPPAPPPPPPTPAQLAAFQTLKTETDSFEHGARDYRDTVTKIILFHYEAKKKQILAGLDESIVTEQAEATKARDIAIARLEEFVRTYAGSRARDPETPDAMYRLASLYSDRARGDAPENLAAGLKPAIALYKRIINEYPNYEHVAGIYYYLGHSYEDSGRIEEAYQVYRSSVCHNHFRYPTPPNLANPDQDTILPAPQDHDEEYWATWRNIHQDEASLKRGGADTTFVDPYPADCQPLPEPDLPAGQEPQYVATTWWDIANWEFEQSDLRGGVVKDQPVAVYDLNRAASAYLHALERKSAAPMAQKDYDLRAASLYKYAWTLFKQNRFEAATKQFVSVLNFSDEAVKKTGSDPGYRKDVYPYIADSLLGSLDFAGPPANEPYMQRPDILDIYPDNAKAEVKLHVAIDRVRDAAIIPQDKPWTINIYLALADDFRSYGEFGNAIEVYTECLKRWPMDPTAPQTQEAMAETYDQLNVARNRPGTPEHDAIAAKSLEARTALANYTGNTPWVDANKDNPEALDAAEKLVKGGLKSAAATHTNNGNAALTEATNTADPNRQAESLSRAVAEYKLAALGWGGYLHQDENASDSYDSRFWLADARYRQVMVEVLLLKIKKGAPPSAQEIAEARQSLIDVRDSNEDDKYLAESARRVVDLSDQDRDIAFAQFVETNGAAGIEQRQLPHRDNNGTGKPIVDPIPPQIQAGIQARLDYSARVPPSLDPAKNGMTFQMYIAGEYYLYGHFDEARAIYEPIYREHCGKDDNGFIAWDHLISMSNMLNDADTSRKLAEAEHNKATACAMTPSESATAELKINPTLQEAAYQKARAKLKEAQAAPAGSPNHDTLWRETAGLFEAALQAAPDRAEAPEGAMNAAFAYKQVGDFTRAIDMYNRFITTYGSEAKLTALQKGDPVKKTPPDAKEYASRVGYLAQAYGELSTTYYSFFNYQRAAETQEKISSNTRFDDKKRKDAAAAAMELYNALGQRDKMTAQYKILTSLHPDADEQASADYTVANYDYKQWNPAAGDAGTNRSARIAAESALIGFWTKEHAKGPAAKYAEEAAYQIAKMKKSVGDPGYHGWLKSVLGEWQFLDTAPAGKDGKKSSQQPPYVDYAAEAEFTPIDEELKQKYDYASGFHHYAGSVEEVIGKVDPKTGKTTSKGKYQVDAEQANKYDVALEHIIKTYLSLDWVPAAFARKGTVWDSLRTGLYNTVPPALKYFTPQQEAQLRVLENSGRDDLADKADQIRSAVKEAWRTNKEKELGGTDTLMVRYYAMAVAYARKFNIRNPFVANAINRLAYYTDVIGDAKMREYVTSTIDPTDPSKQGHLAYTDGMFVQQRPGLTAVPPADANKVPAPVAP